jgi:hypothetical protein
MPTAAVIPDDARQRHDPDGGALRGGEQARIRCGVFRAVGIGRDRAKQTSPCRRRRKRAGPSDPPTILRPRSGPPSIRPSLFFRPQSSSCDFNGRLFPSIRRIVVSSAQLTASMALLGIMTSRRSGRLMTTLKRARTRRSWRNSYSGPLLWLDRPHRTPPRPS